jgi:hypothetical protein
MTAQVGDNARGPLAEAEAGALRDVVRRLAGDVEAEVTDWQGRSIYEPAMAATGGVYRYEGRARVRGEEVPWSVVLKRIRKPRPDAPASVQSPRSWAYWEREVLAYESGLLAAVTAAERQWSIRVPVCFGVDRREEEVWLWLEDVRASAPPWPRARYRMVAQKLGGFNGAFAVGPTVADYPWLLLMQLRVRAASVAPRLEGLLAERAREMMRRGWPGDLLERGLALNARREELLDVLQRMPQVFQHGDADPRNVLVRTRGGHEGTDQVREEVVGIDWALTGIGPLGDDLATFVLQTVLWFQGVAPGDLKEFAEEMEAAYIEGLQQVGWHGDERVLRATCGIAMGLRALYRPQMERVADDPIQRDRWERVMGHPMEEIAECCAAVRQYAFRRAEEAAFLLT